MPKRRAQSSPSPNEPQHSPEMHREVLAVAEDSRAQHRDQSTRPAPANEISPKQAFQQALEAQLKDWDTKLDFLRAKARAAKAEVRAEFEIQLEDLEGERAVAQEKLQELRRHGEWAWEDLKDGADQAWKELRELIERVASRLK